MSNLFYLIACVTGVFLPLLICVVVMLIKDSNNRKKARGLDFSDIKDRRPTTKSAPISRNERERNLGDTSDETTPSPHGRLCFSVLYDSSTNKLLVTLIKAKDLEGRCIEENYRDPFVKVFLLPNEHIWYTSKVIKKTLGPVFNETFTFEINTEDVENSSLRFSVYDVDRRRLRHTLGHAIVALRDINVNSSEILWRDLVHESTHGSSVGEMHLALTYLPHLERLKLVILRSRSIHPKPDQDTGFFVRILQFYGNKLAKTKQTLTQSAVPEINFNESFAFSTSNKNIENFNFIVTLVQTSRNALCSDVELGQISLGSFMFARGAGLIHWQEMLAQTRTVVAKWHQLSVPV